ncbi:MAG: hypothetical protein J6B68_09965 [Lachnospiraceae bacterium]|nr:hypothetical protein [Lachnospiraceae bacterium]
MVEQDNLTIYAIMIPMQQKKWKPKKLLRLMRDAQERIVQSEEKQIVLHPDIAEFLNLEKEEIPDIFFFLSTKILGLQKTPFDSVVLLLGKDMFPELQMRYFAEMMQPFFSRMNHLTILYEADEEEQDRWQEAIEDYTDAFYYEYGLMAQIFGTKERDSQSGYKRYGRENTQRNGERTFFIDYGYAGAIPFRMMRDGDTYLDVAASGKKEMLLKRKCAEVSYLSPLKYLDTTVKSGYDKLVHLCK